MPVGTHKLVHSYLGSRILVYSIQKHITLNRKLCVLAYEREREREREREDTERHKKRGRG